MSEETSLHLIIAAFDGEMGSEEALKTLKAAFAALLDQLRQAEREDGL